MRTSGTFAASRFDLGGSVKLAASKQRDRQRSSEMATDPSEFVSIFSPGGTRLTLPPASPAGSEAGGVGSAQSSQPPAQQGAAGSVVQKILGGPSGSIGSVGGGSDTAGNKTGATEPVTPAPVSPARIGDGPGEQRTGAQSPPVMMSPEMLAWCSRPFWQRAWQWWGLTCDSSQQGAVEMGQVLALGGAHSSSSATPSSSALLAVAGTANRAVPVAHGSS